VKKIFRDHGGVITEDDRARSRSSWVTSSGTCPSSARS
jgi:hypothetical protein